jgi:hypothetical protein
MFTSASTQPAWAEEGMVHIAKQNKINPARNDDLFFLFIIHLMIY